MRIHLFFKVTNPFRYFFLVTHDHDDHEFQGGLLFFCFQCSGLFRLKIPRHRWVFAGDGIGSLSSPCQPPQPKPLWACDSVEQLAERPELRWTSVLEEIGTRKPEEAWEVVWGWDQIKTHDFWTSMLNARDEHPCKVVPVYVVWCETVVSWF